MNESQSNNKTNGANAHTWIQTTTAIIGTIIAVLAFFGIANYADIFQWSDTVPTVPSVVPTPTSTITVSASTSLESDRPLTAIAPSERNGYYDSFPETVIDESKSYEAVIKTTHGNMRLRLFAKQAPKTVNNFVFLAQQGFYDDTTFHRVFADFIAHAGDPTGVGTGGPGYQFENETSNGLSFYRRGLLAMANAGPGTNGSQFFITFAKTPWLDGNYTIFGELIEGDNVLSSLRLRDPASDSNPGDTIESVEIYEGQR